MKTAIIYARTKGDLSDYGLISVKGQFQVCKEYADENDIKVVGLFADILLIGNKSDFQNWQHIVNNKKPNYDYVIVYNHSRIGRNINKALKERAKLKERGVSVISASEPMSDDEENLILTLLGELHNGRNV